MAERQETVTDIIAEKRRQAKYIERDYAEKMKRGEMVSDCYARALVADIRCEADRLEAALKRELGDAAKEVEDLKSRVKLWTDRADELRKKCDEFYARAKTTGNSAALREALELARLYISLSPEAESRAHVKNGQIEMLHAIDVLDKISAALSAPARNCDVGTEQEQAERYGRYCDKFTRDGMHCEACPCCGKIQFGKCEFAWAQMPYVETKGGNDGSK